MKRRMTAVSAIGVLLVALLALSAFAAPATMYFATDKNGANKVTQLQEGTQVWIVVDDPDDNIDCGLRDKIWVDLKVFDPKTGAYSVWNSGGYLGVNVHNDDVKALDYDYLEETTAASGKFVSKRPFQIGTREDYTLDRKNTHIVGPYTAGTSTVTPLDFQWGHYEYGPLTDWTSGTNVHGDTRGWYGPRQDRPTTKDWPFTEGLMDPTAKMSAVLPSVANSATFGVYLLGRFENMDTVCGMFQSPRDPRNVATTQLKIVDHVSTLTWDAAFHTSPRTAATIMVHDTDENLDCNRVEFVPVFIIVNPGSWNPLTLQTKPFVFSPNEICSLIRFGGVAPLAKSKAVGRNIPIRWYNIYDSGLAVPPPPTNKQEAVEGTYYMQYPVIGSTDWKGKAPVTTFDTDDPDGYCRVMFWAEETGTNTGDFQLNLNSILTDLGFTMLNVGDVLVAYYLDPNDFDDFQVASMYIGTAQDASNYSVTTFTNVNQSHMGMFAIGLDSVYIQVIDQNANMQPCCPEEVFVHICDPHEEDDSEWVVLEEQGSNTPIFFTNAATELLPVWDAVGIGLAASKGGYQLQLDNWQLEVFNEDSVYAQYNDVTYDRDEKPGLGDVNIQTSFPPYIESTRVRNDLSYDLMKVTDNQVFNGTSDPTMYFLDENKNRISGYINSQNVFIEVVDSDQNEDNGRRERIDGYWDGGQNIPFGPMALNPFECNATYCYENPVNRLLGDTNIFNDNPTDSAAGFGLDACLSKKSGAYRVEHAGWAKLYVLNPRNGRWAATDLWETASASGDFVSVVCIPLVSPYPCVPSLDVQPGDTVIAHYQDPSNHSDSSWISLKVGQGGGTSTVTKSTIAFANQAGQAVQSYTDVDSVYVKVVDTSHTGAPSLPGAVKIGSATFDLAPLAGVTSGFITRAITMTELGKQAGATITATYTDPTDLTDTASVTVSVVASVLQVDEVYAKPTFFTTTTAFAFKGTGVPIDFTVTITAPGSSEVLWTATVHNATEVVWDGTATGGVKLANGPYVFVAVLKGNNGTLPAFHGTVVIDGR